MRPHGTVAAARGWRQMDDDAAILHAEVAALQAVLISVLRSLARDQPDLVDRFCAAFDEAESVLTGLALRSNHGNAGRTTIDALRVVEEIRAGVLRGDANCPTGN